MRRTKFGYRAAGHPAGVKRAAAVALSVMLGFGAVACSDSGEEATNEPAATDASSADNADQAAGEGDNKAEDNKDNVFAVKKGDCLQLGESMAGEVKSLDTRDCKEEHDAEVYAEKEMTDANFPGVEAAAKQAQEYCAAEFEPFIGKKGDESELSVRFLHPSQESWDQEDDRAIQCIVADPGAKLKDTLKDAKR